VVEVGWVNGLAALRSLGRAGLRVLAVDHRPWALGFKSRFAEAVVAPEPGADEAGFVAALEALAERLEAPAPVFPTHDEHLNAIARHADRLAAAYRFPFPSWDVLERVQRKRHQLEAAERIGFPVPKHAHAGSAEEARAAAADLGLPVFLKPSDLAFKRELGRQAFRCFSLDEVEAAYARMEPFAPIVQETIPGGDEELYTLGSYLAVDGTPLGLFCGRKLRQTLPWMGSARTGEALWVDEVVDSGLRLLEELRFHGISQVEVKRDPRDGRFKLMEVNPRLWQWHGLAAACGVDLPLIAYRDLVGERPDPVRQIRERKRWTITYMADNGLALTRPPYVDGVFALDDPKPALAQAVRLTKRIARRRSKAPADGAARKPARA
jgi:D-aspartate ligase